MEVLYAFFISSITFYANGSIKIYFLSLSQIGVNTRQMCIY